MERIFECAEPARDWVTRSGRWLDRLGHPEPAAWADLDRARAELAEADPVRRAIDYRLDGESAERRAAANPALAHAARRARDEPFAFDRLVLEWARRRTSSRRDISFAVLDACVALFERRLFDPERAGTSPMPRALLALALAYRADDRRVSGHHAEAERDLARARHHVDGLDDGASSGEAVALREIRATILEMRVDLANSQRDHATAEPLLDTIRGLLADVPIPGRRAEALWRLGRLELARDRDDRAAIVLEQAAFELPDDLDFHLRLDILHLRAFAEAAVGSFERAAFYLAKAEPLVDRWGHGLIVAQRHHLLGHLARIDRRHEDAEEHWLRSYRLSLSLDHQLDAMQTVASLLRLWRRGPAVWRAKQDQVRELVSELRRAAVNAPCRRGRSS